MRTTDLIISFFGVLGGSTSLIISSGHILTLAENNTELMIKKGYKDFIIETDWRLKTVYEDIEKFKNESLESDANLLKAISNNSDDIKSSVWKFHKMTI